MLQHKKQYFAKCDAAIAEWRKLGPQPLNTIPRTLTGEPMSVEEEETLSVQQTASESVTEGKIVKKSTPSFPEDESAEEKKNDDDQYVAATTTATPQAEPSSTSSIKQGDNVTTAYGVGEVLAIASESLEIKLPYGVLFVRLTETVRKVETTTVPPKDCHSGIWLFTDRENITHFFKPNFLPPYDTPEKKKIILDVLREEWDEKTLSWKPCGQGSMTKNKTTTSTTMGMHLNHLDQLMGDVISTINGCCTPQAKPNTSSH